MGASSSSLSSGFNCIGCMASAVGSISVPDTVTGSYPGADTVMSYSE